MAFTDSDYSWHNNQYYICWLQVLTDQLETNWINKKLYFGNGYVTAYASWTLDEREWQVSVLAVYELSEA